MSTYGLHFVQMGSGDGLWVMGEGEGLWVTGEGEGLWGDGSRVTAITSPSPHPALWGAQRLGCKLHPGKPDI